MTQMVGYKPDSDDGEFSLMPDPTISLSGQAKTESEADDEDGFSQCLTTPLVQVFSVCLSTVFNDGKPCEIHGSIRVFEQGPHCQFDLYDRFPEDSETILESGTSLSLIGPHGGAIIPSMRTTLVFRLKDRIHGVDVVNGELKLDLSTEGSYDRLQKGVVEGAHGSAFVYYVVFRFAIYGYVQVTLAKNDDNAVDIYGNLKAEVFTVFVGGINEKISALCGTISVDDGSLDRYSIYKTDESCKELLRDHSSLVCIEFNYRAIQNCEFYVILNLTDPVGKLEVSRGYACFHLGYHGQNMYDRRLCSIVPGKDGYAAVHFEVFENAFEAILEVKLFAANGDLDIPTSLYGTLLACYSGHNYSTSYEKLYYKSRLIDLPLDSAVKSKTGSEIALLKSIVVVPARSTLIIEANLNAFGINNVVEPINGKAEFEINMRDTISKIIRGQDYCIEISVKFKA